MLTPTPGVEAIEALATSMEAAPGVYAVLVGSGMSSAAGIPTGYQVLGELITRVAKVRDPDLEVENFDPHEWWRLQNDAAARYDTVIQALAPTDGIRRKILEPFFEPDPTGPTFAQPTLAHRELARLCKKGLVRVILTTNFDRLIERALAEEGLDPQILSDNAAFKDPVPFMHSPVTVIKLHGDYRHGKLLNSADELATYPSVLRKLLGRVLDEFGLVVVGWSAEWDTALAQAVRNCPSRRYPIYWTLHQGAVTEAARDIFGARPVHTLDTQGADAFFTDLGQRVKRLEEAASRRSTLRHSSLVSLIQTSSSNPPQGWNQVPALWLQIAVQVEPVPIDEVDLIREPEREAFVDALNRAPLKGRLYEVTGRPAALSQQTTWGPTPGVHQSGQHGSYAFPTSAGASPAGAIASVRFPPLGYGQGAVFALDIGISVPHKVDLIAVAGLFKAGLELVTGPMPTAMARVLPPQALPSAAQIRISAMGDPTPDQRRGTGNLADRVALDQFGTCDGGPSSFYSYGLLLGGAAPTSQQATHVALDMIERMVYELGYTRPSTRLAVLRAQVSQDVS